MLKIYTDFTLLKEHEVPCTMLLPFWKSVEPEEDVDAGRFDNYFKSFSTYFQSVDSIEKAEVCVLPMEYSHKRAQSPEVISYALHARQHNVPFLVFYNNDDDSDILIEDAIVFRTSFSKSKKKEREYAYPAWSVDFSEYYSKNGFVPLPKTRLPKVGYCGYVDYTNDFSSRLNHRLKRFFGGGRSSYGTQLRGRAIRVLDRCSQVDSDFIIRKGFWAAGVADKGGARAEYAANMLSCPYALVVRGAGNFSYRLYEVLSCGRIPVFIDTDCGLPFEDQIDWSCCMLKIPVEEIDSVGVSLASFHQKLDPVEFEEIQRNARKVYEDWIRPESFFKQLASVFRPRT